jgi:hypothetical protein
MPMTRNQVTHALTSTANSYGVWTTLEGDFLYITLESDKNIYGQPNAVQFYFSPSADYFLVRYTGREYPVLYTGGTIPLGYVLIVHDGKQYMVKIEDGGVEDNSPDEAGIYHEIYAFSSISGLFYK